MGDFTKAHAKVALTGLQQRIFDGLVCLAVCVLPLRFQQLPVQPLHAAAAGGHALRPRIVHLHHNR